MPKQGLYLITPSAAVATGTGSSATINAQGSISFSTITGIELRGVFSSEYENYQIVSRWTHSGSAGIITGQLVSGSTAASGTDYNYQNLQVTGSSASGTSTSSDTNFNLQTSSAPQGFVLFMYQPNIADKTYGCFLGMDGGSGGRILDTTWVHDLATSYDGVKFNLATGTASGIISVYGMRK